MRPRRPLSCARGGAGAGDGLLWALHRAHAGAGPRPGAVRGGCGAAGCRPAEPRARACAAVRRRADEVRYGPRPLGGRTVACRYAFYSELSALPTAVDWPDLREL